METAMSLIANQPAAVDEDLWRLLQAQARASRHDLTEATARRILEIAPGDPFAEQFLAAALLKQGRTDEARSVLLRSASLNPENGQASHMLSTMHFIAGEFEAAISHAIDAVGREPVNFAYMMFLGKLLFCAGRFEESLVACERAVQLEPEHPAALSGLARTLGKLRLEQRAREVVTTMTRIAPEDAACLCEAGWTFLDLGLFDEAARHLRSSLAVDPGWGSTFAGLALVEHQRGNAAGASDFAKEAVCLDPVHLPALSPLLQARKAG
jgi:tetratricopeptide (TPR) repeat protein